MANACKKEQPPSPYTQVISPCFLGIEASPQQ